MAPQSDLGIAAGRVRIGRPPARRTCGRSLRLESAREHVELRGRVRRLVASLTSNSCERRGPASKAVSIYASNPETAKNR